MGNPKEAKDYIPYAADQGIAYLAGAAKAGVSIQAKQITQVGAAPCVVDLEDEGLSPMADTDYVVIVQGETAAAVMVDQSTMTVNGFNILGGADTEVLHVLIVGCVKGQAQL